MNTFVLYLIMDHRHVKRNGDLYFLLTQPSTMEKLMKEKRATLANVYCSFDVKGGMELLKMLLNNCGEPVHRQVIDNGLLPILVKIVKKMDLPVREKIFLLLDATQTSLGGAKARFPQYYEAYYELVVGIIFAAENFP
ncbi:hypothetical protein Zm00014a_041663 [Zea mays]|uniref:VHS domain-containing protein n=1 Tax=Zea mays TaxID=4577 RepID=A0A3L6EKG3_MAIZE|nr:hypothetical protein Zm00014a_041663 [Zea mays]